MADAYQKVKSNKLKFKGDGDKKKKRKRVVEGGASSSSSSSSYLGAEIEGATIVEAEGTEEEEEEEIKIVTATGRITSSGQTIYGHATKFSDELVVGDAIIVTHPTSLVEETKIVKMVLSNVSISVSSNFSTDLISTTSFKYVKAPVSKRQKEETEEEKRAKSRIVAKESEEAAFGIGYCIVLFSFLFINPASHHFYR